MAHIKAGGVAKGNKDSTSKRLGVKIYGGQIASPGNILIRQRGTRVFPAAGTDVGHDHTIFATVKGIVTFFTKRGKEYISVLPAKN
jgi:large subunit ribosomal protein L27